MKLKKIEELFNETFYFEKLVNDTIVYIKGILADSKNNFLEEDEERINYPFNDLRVEYNRTHILINNLINNPLFRLEFYLYEIDADIPKFTYEIEYNSQGEFLDEYFLEY